MRSNLYQIFIAITMLVLAAKISTAQYCTTNLYYFGCLYGDYIDNVSVGSVSQTATGCGTNGYSDYTSLVSSFEQGSAYTLKVTTSGYGHVVSMWIDFDDDFTFDAQEKLISYFNCSNPGTEYTANFVIPVGAVLGEHRMRIRSVTYPYPFPFDACVQQYYGEVHDYTAHITPPSNMTYSSSTTTQTVTDAVSLGSTDVQIIGIQVVTSGSISPIGVTSFKVNSNGTTNYSGDVTNVKLYYTGTSSVFSPDNLFGSGTNLSNPITGSQVLEQGVNYFWAAYDISASGTIGNYLDAECTQVTVDGNNYTPSITAPAGNRQLGYCTPTSTYSCYFAYIDGVVFNTLSNTTTYCNGSANGYINYAPGGSLTTTVEAGSSYPITLTAPFFDYVGLGVWIDFNNDGDFSDADEFVYNTATTVTNSVTGTISIPNNASYTGTRRMRVRSHSYTVINSSQSCSNFDYGEAEDYTITINPASPMAYVSSTVTQNNTEFLEPGTNDAEIVGIQVVTSGALSPFDLTSFTINSNGSTNFSSDVSNVKIYYTGTDAAFGTTTLFGSATNLSSPITGNVTLAAGTNYFWVAYDVKTTAILGDYLDAECTQIVMTGSGGTQVPSVTAPTGSRQLNYCAATTTNGCNYGYIDDVVFNSLSNYNSGCNGSSDGYIQYDPIDFTTSVEQGGTYPITMEGGPAYDYVGFGVWIDFNNDGDFDDSDEFVWSSPSAVPGIQYGSIAIPLTATVGDHRMRIRSKEYYILFANESCGELFYYNGETEDYTISIVPPGNMFYESSTCIQNNLATVSLGATDEEIIGIQVVTSGSLNPFNVTSFTLNSLGSSDFTNDVTNVKIYYTGTSPVFAATNLFGSSTTLAAPINGSQQLAGGANYFWVAFDISTTGTLGNFLDAECTQIVMDGGVGTQFPTVTAPAGFREINFCIGENLYGCYYTYVDGVTFNTIDNTASYCNGSSNGYILYPQSGSTTTQVDLGNTYSIQLDAPPYYVPVGFGVWIDYNGDGDFEDSDEFVYSSPYYTSGSQLGTITIACNDAYLGDRRMRVRVKDYSLVSSTESCTQFYYGETEDYTITVGPATSDMSYTSSTCTQNNQTSVGINIPDVEILGIQVAAEGCNNPLTASSFTLSSTGTTNFATDVTNVKIYYTGNSSVFATTTLFGSAPDVSAPITGSQELTAGINYFWVAYDVSANAAVGNYLDAGCTEINITGQGNVTPSTTNPFGSRQINYCVPIVLYGCFYGDYIDDVTLNTLSNQNTGCSGTSNSYINYAPSGSLTTNLEQGSTYTISLATATTFNQEGWAIWIDYNNDLDFADPNEFIAASPTYQTSYSTSFIVPVDASNIGERRMRIRCANYTTFNSDNWCDGTFYYGETEDYTITIDAAPNCTGTPIAGTVTADPPVLCTTGDVALTLAGYSIASDLSFQWQSSPDGSTWSNISGGTNITYTANQSSSTYYRAQVTCDNSGLSAFTASLLVKTGGTEQITSSTGATVCGEGIVDITASGNSDLVLWYAALSGGSPLYYSSSPSTYSPYVNTTTTYYAAAATGQVSTGNVGPVDNSIGPIDPNYTYVAQFFNVMKKCRIMGVYVYPVQAGDLQIQLTDANYYLLKSTTVAIDVSQINQKTFVQLDWEVEVGNNYHLGWAYPSILLYSSGYTTIPYAYPFTLNDVISITNSSYGPNYYFYFYDWVIDYSVICESVRTPVTVTVTPSTEITVAPDPVNATICQGSGQSVTLTAAGPYSTYNWAPPDGLSSTTGAVVSASPTQTTSYIVTASDGTCANQDTITVNVAIPPAVTATALPDAVCLGGSSQLFASTPAVDYTVSQITFDPVSSNGATPINFFYEGITGALPLGFTFNFYGNDYSQFYLSNNGWLSFTSTLNSGCCQGQELPDPTDPNNLIAFAWEDLEPYYGGTVTYITTGTAPYRKLIIEFKDVPHYYAGDLVTVQTILYETTNVIEIHTTSMPGNPSSYWWAPHTMGIENADGSKALAVPGRNADATWTATNDAWRFSPIPYVYSWSPSATLSDPAILNPVATPTATTTYSVTVTDNATLCASTSSVTVSVVSTPVAGSISPDMIEFCGSGSASLELIGYSPGATIQWQESATSGGPYSDIPGATSSSYTTPTLSTDNYYVASVSCLSSTSSTEAQVAINAAPLSPTGIDGGNCGPGVVVLGADAAGSGSLDWYFSQTGDDFIGTGSPFTSPYINQSTTFWVEEAGNPTPTPLQTTLTGSNIANGNMFDITAINDVFITGFDVVMSQFYTSDIEIYYKLGSYAGSEYNASNWTLLGVASNVTGLGAGNATPVPVPLYLHVSAGETVGIYITCTNYSAYFNFLYGTQVGNVYAQDANIQVKEGNYMGYPFAYYSTPIVWNGKVHYVAPGCASPRTPVLAEIYQPQISATASAAAICEGASITLTAINSGAGNFIYEWSPQLYGMVPQNGLNDTVTVTPPVTMTFTVSVTDPNAPLCDTTITVPITVNTTPGVFISNLDPQYYTNSSPVVLIGVPPGGTFSGSGVSGNIFDPDAAGVGGPYTITYTYTDAIGCIGIDSQNTYVVALEGIGDLLTDQNILFFPNPSEGLFNMSINLPSPAESVMVTIYDVIGKEIFFNDFGSVQDELLATFDFSKQAKSSYLVTINVDGQLFYRKLSIQ